MSTSGPRNLEQELILSSHNQNLSSYAETSRQSQSQNDDCSAGAMSAD